MGLAIWLLTVLAERLNQTRIGRMITTGIAVFVIAYGIIVALLITNLLILALLGYL
ncbi:MAG TPA: hypothetical protein VGJ78_09870 [Vicinamibacterales bacterium]|jgi:hypothetical protein